jgi:hypothetical protein
MAAKTVHPKYREPQPVKTGGWLSIGTAQFKVAQEDAEHFGVQLKEQGYCYNSLTVNGVVHFDVYVTFNPNQLGAYKPA